MRSGFGITLIMVLVLASGALYYSVEAICPIPLEYRIGELDERFGLTQGEAKLAALNAESIWEGATDRNLFNYREDADFAINFIFDERQAVANAEDDFKDKLDAAEEVNENITATYNDLLEEYENLQTKYQQKIVSYEADLSAYNAVVEKYNREGGAPPDEFEKLKREQQALSRQQAELNIITKELNQMVDEINRLGNQGNKLIETYNEGVSTYNQKFGEPREFTQGDYQGDRINIYTFENQTELELVLAHELGHALHLGHVEGEQSIMYYLIGDQPSELDLSQTDMTEFSRICGTGSSSFIERLKLRLGL